jgi:PhzF family phenazine biosynthesis protein
MSDPLAYKLVDAFTTTPFTGNVAGVILDAAGLTDSQMQAIATEFNASETTFVLPPTSQKAAVRFRWFTPGCEVNFCGHATIGAAHALFEEGRFRHCFDEPGSILPIETKSGILTLRTERPGGDHPYTLWLDMPHCEPKKTAVAVPNVARYLNLNPAMIDPSLPAIRTQDDDVILAVKDMQTLLEMQPSMSDLRRYGEKEGLRGILVTTTNVLTRANVVQSRFFAPMSGVDEDPVTGSVHGPLGLHLVNSGIVALIGGKADFYCAQAKAGGRAGLVRIIVKESRDSARTVRIGGSCVTTAEGTLRAMPGN